MERVSFEVAKILKEVGYPQDIEDTVYLNNGETYTFDDVNPLFKYVPNYCCDAPTYLDVWLWLWQEKKIYIQVEIKHCTLSFPWGDSCTFKNNSPEESIAAAIEYIVTNNLIK